MDNLGAYIIELLQENDKVYLPGLGTFEKERIPARFDETTNSFLAPSTRLVLTHDKGSPALLVQAISLSENKNVEESEKQLKNELGRILLELNEKGHSTVEKLGTLSKEKEGAIVFTAADKEEEEFSFYKAVSEAKLIAASQKEINPIEAVPQEESAPEPLLSAKEFEPKGRPINWLWPFIILVVLAGAGAFWFFNPSVLENKKTETQQLKSPEEEDLGNIQDSLLQSAEAMPILEGDSVATITQEDIEPQKPKITFEIVVVSFGKLAEAENYVKKMNAKGYQTHIIENKRPGNLFKVSAGSHTDEVEAQAELSQIRKELSKEAWIFKNNN